MSSAMQFWIAQAMTGLRAAIETARLAADAALERGDTMEAQAQDAFADMLQKIVDEAPGNMRLGGDASRK